MQTEGTGAASAVPAIPTWEEMEARRKRKDPENPNWCQFCDKYMQDGGWEVDALKARDEVVLPFLLEHGIEGPSSHIIEHPTTKEARLNLGLEYVEVQRHGCMHAVILKYHFNKWVKYSWYSTSVDYIGCPYNPACTEWMRDVLLPLLREAKAQSDERHARLVAKREPTAPLPSE